MTIFLGGKRLRDKDLDFNSDPFFLAGAAKKKFSNAGL